MKKLPHMRWTDARAARSRLEAWLREWAIDRRLTVGGHAPLETPAAGPAAREARAEPAASCGVETVPEAGQIRLLAPVDETSHRRVVYIVLLDRGAGGGWLAAPFGRFATPAVPGEWTTGMKAAALRVLCAWNARRLPDARVRASWVVGRLTPRALKTARELHAADRARAPIPGRLAGKAGPPLRHPLDPRWEYLDEERGVMDAAAGVGAGAGGGGSIRYPFAESDLALAAEARAIYETGRILFVKGKGLRLRLAPAPRGAGWRVSVEDAQGMPTAALDGAALRRPGTPAPAATVRRGRARLSAGPAPDSLEVVQDEGRPSQRRWIAARNPLAE